MASINPSDTRTSTIVGYDDGGLAIHDTDEKRRYENDYGYVAPPKEEAAPPQTEPAPTTTPTTPAPAPKPQNIDYSKLSAEERLDIEKKNALSRYYATQEDLNKRGKGVDAGGYKVAEPIGALDMIKGTLKGGLMGLILSGGNPIGMLGMAMAMWVGGSQVNYRRSQAQQLLDKGYQGEFVDLWTETGDDRILAQGKKGIIGTSTFEKEGKKYKVNIFSDGTESSAIEDVPAEWSGNITLGDGSTVQFMKKSDGSLDLRDMVDGKLPSDPSSWKYTRMVNTRTDQDVLKQREAELQLQAKYREPKTVQTGWVDHKLDPNDPTRVIQRKVDANGNFIMNGDKFIERDVLGSSAQQKLTQRSRADEKQYTELQQTAERLTDEAANAEFLADEIENSKQWRTGVFGKWTESFNDLVGSQDAVSALKKAYLDRKNKEVINGLPPGAASDNDIRIFMSGFPSENANKETLVSWLRGKAKAQRLAAENADRKLDWMDQNGSLSKKDSKGNSFQKVQRSATPATPAPKEEVKTEPTTPSNLGKRLGLAPAGWEEGSVKKNGSRTVTVYQGYVYEMK